MNVRRIFLAGVLFASCLFSQSLFAQASTEGKEFWVAQIMTVRPPDDGPGKAWPYIAVSAEKPNTTITITNPNNPNLNVQYTTTKANEWVEFGDKSDPNKSYTVNLPQSEWYPQNVDETNDIVTHADEKNNFGLRVTASENISVFSVIRAYAAMDAANILPKNALQSSYCIQDYLPDAKDGDGQIVSMVTILALEDNTAIDITPTSNTYNNAHLANNTFTINLNKGQTYYLIGKHHTSISGTKIIAKADKKIAVFQGNACTRIPNGIGNRDCLYEQAMPIDYWGTQFVITRSMGKDANFFKITTIEDNTTISIDGKIINLAQGGSSYEIEVNKGEMKNTDKITHAADLIISSGDAHYIESSCPIAIYKYDVGTDYEARKGSEKDGMYGGDPSSVWISPIQQKINKITFGTCHTALTTKHYLDIVCLTSDINSVSIVSNSNHKIVPTFALVPNNTTYSYARLLISDKASEKVFTISNNSGFIAQVYGHGKSESYAYSAGSAAVKRGVNIDGTTHTEGTISDQVYCVQTPIEFDAQVGTDVIDKVDWDFGDGVTITNGPTKTTHTYDSPGWYDITANVYAHKECPYTTYPAEAVSFSFRVRRPDTTRVVVRGDCMPWDYTGKLQEIDSVQPDDCATDTFEIRTIVYGKDTRDTTDHGDMIVHDSIRIEETGKWLTYDFAPGGKGLYEDSIVSENKEGCRHTHVYRYNLTILTCLNMQVSDASEAICADPQADDTEMYTIPFTYHKGQIAHAALLLNGKRINAEADLSAQTLSVPLNEIEPGIWNATIEVWDSICSDTLSFPYRFVANYPEYVFRQKFDNVLAVYTTAFNGGYTFTRYQWYKDGEPIDGATSSIYHTTDPLPAGATYYVLLTREDGLVLPSCEQTIESNNANAQSAPKAEKVISNKHLYIKLNGTLFDVYGNRVE